MSLLPVDWSRKARALLLPSPFHGVDSDGEPARARIIEEWLRSHGSQPFDEGLLERSRADAYDANALLDSSTGDAPAPARVEPKHPLSGAALFPAFSRADAAELWRRFWQSFSQGTKDLGPVDNAAGYRDLFRAWSAAASMDAGALDTLPTDQWRPDCPVWSHRRLASALVGARSGAGRPALLFLHLGPVQSFIEAARRTHDLWLGSFMVSFLVLHAAKALSDALGPDALVYPDVAHLLLGRKVVFGEAVEESSREQLLRASVSNHVLALVPLQGAAASAQEAMSAARETWRHMAEAVRNALGQDMARWSNGDPWKGFGQQIDGHLEMDAVVQPWPENRAQAEELFAKLPVAKALGRWPEAHATRIGFGYGDVFDLTHRVLAAHRETYLTAPEPESAQRGEAAQIEGDARPKCTQCGLREQMGPCNAAEARRQHAQSRDFWLAVAEHAKDAELQIKDGEGLCAVCLTKRFAPRAYFGTEPARLGISWHGTGAARQDRVLLRFPSTATIASAPFRGHVKERAPEEARAWAIAIEHLNELLDFNAPGNLLPHLGPLGTADPFLSQDGSWLYQASYDPEVAWTDHQGRRPTSSDRVDGARYANFCAGLSLAHATYREMRAAAKAKPSPYFAVLKLDGDHMGEWLTGRHPHTPTVGTVLANLASYFPPSTGEQPRPLFPALHGELARRLAALAHRLHEIVGGHLGKVVYTGGDDLLALVPLETLLSCLAEIRAAFRGEQHLGERVTISAGVAVAHFRDPLQRAVKEARRAEQEAKVDRNSLSIRLLKRSGDDVTVVLPWEVGRSSTCEVLGALIDHASRSGGTDEEQCLASPKVAYRLAGELAELGLADKSDEHDAPLREAFLQRIEVLLGYRDKRTGKPTGEMPPMMKELLPGTLVKALLIARFLLRERLCASAPPDGGAGTEAAMEGDVR
jgi:CRISPR-associated protein Cmr2